MLHKDERAIEGVPPDTEVVIYGEKPQGTFVELKRTKKRFLDTEVIVNPGEYYSFKVLPA
jgi:hypothetical protein